jgi:DNA gyrase/topoisomerase IV subunit B
MSFARDSVRALPDSVVEKLLAGVRIVSPTHCVEQLIYNSIDAEADCIAIRVDLNHRWKIVVVDNGTGIHPVDLEKVGDRSDHPRVPLFVGWITDVTVFDFSSVNSESRSSSAV